MRVVDAITTQNGGGIAFKKPDGCDEKGGCQIMNLRNRKNPRSGTLAWKVDCCAPCKRCHVSVDFATAGDKDTAKWLLED